MGDIVLGILAHVDAGKTTLSEALLYKSGSIRKAGRVDNGSAFLDTDQQEKKRGITIFSSQARLQISGRNVTLLDTPGHADFSAEMERTLQVLDYAVLVINGADGVQGHTRTLWKLLKASHVPVFLFVNKMDQPGTDRAALMGSLKDQLSDSCVDFSAGREQIDDELAMCSEQVMDTYLETGSVPLEDARALVRQRKVFPCFFGSALKMEGIDDFMEGIGALMEEKKYPPAFGARVFKISRDEQGSRLTHLKITGGSLMVRDELAGEKVNQIRLYSGARYVPADRAEAGTICAVTGPVHTRAGDGIGSEKGHYIPLLEPVLTYKVQLPDDVDIHRALDCLYQLEEEDPQLHILWEEFLGEIHIQLMGAIQTEVLADLIERRFGFRASFTAGRILYKETIESPVEGVGHFEPLRHYAEVHLRLEPGERGSGLVFADECPANMLDRNWRRLILSNLKEKEHLGVLTGSPITDMKISLIAGKAHTKHTEGGDFRQASHRALRQGLMKAKSVILEPFFDFRLELPQENVGRAMTDIDRMGGEAALEGADPERMVLTGRAPAAGLQDYQREVTAYTGGKGVLSCTPAGYFPCRDPQAIWEQIGYDPRSDLDNTPDSVFCAHGCGFVVPWYAVERYMHLPGAGLPDYSGMTGRDLQWYEDIEDGDTYSEGQTGKAGAAGRGKADYYAGEDELREIFERTYGPIRRRTAQQASVIRAPQKEYVYKEPKKKPDKEQYLLVDGYNVIYAWDDLRQLADHSMDAARNKLMEVLSNYQGYTGTNVILVFDAYKVRGFGGEVSRWRNIDLVFTREAETADNYIEKTAHAMGRKYHVTVATSDGTEQVIIRSQGCLLMSSRELRTEIERVNRVISEEHLSEEKTSGVYLSQVMPEEVKNLQ